MEILWQLARARNALADKVTRLLLGIPAESIVLRRVGSDYGGFWVPEQLLVQTNSGVLISAGLGGDVSFDKVMRGLGYRVIALDPLPECASFARQELGGDGVIVLQAGLWSSDGAVTFYAPRVEDHDSWSVISIQETSAARARQFEVLSLQTIFERYPDYARAHPKILKVNTEGAEAEVLAHLLCAPIDFDAILVHLESVSQVRLRSPLRFLKQCASSVATLKGLRRQGFRLARSENLQMVLVKPPGDPDAPSQ